MTLDHVRGTLWHFKFLNVTSQTYYLCDCKTGTHVRLNTWYVEYALDGFCPSMKPSFCHSKSYLANN
jgi:hypothetical protein